MLQSLVKPVAKRRLAQAGIRLNGTGPTGLEVRKPERVFSLSTLWRGSLALGELYEAEAWNGDPYELTQRVIRAKLTEPGGFTMIRQLMEWARGLLPADPFAIAEAHYDLGNAFYERLLAGGPMVYSCGYWSEGAASLKEAQEAKMRLLTEKLQLRPGMKVLDIGGGFGELAAWIAQAGVTDLEVTMITVSKEQCEWAKEHFKHRGLTFRLMPYQELLDEYGEGSFGRIVSVGAFEHFGNPNYKALKLYRQFFRICQRLLTDDGLLVLHTIDANQAGGLTNAWIAKYIFPGGRIPGSSEILCSTDGLLTLEHSQNIGMGYDPTLLAWAKNLETHREWVIDEFDRRFGSGWGMRIYRRFEFYLLTCAALFHENDLQVHHYVFSKQGVPGGYTV